MESRNGYFNIWSNVFIDEYNAYLAKSNLSEKGFYFASKSEVQSINVRDVWQLVHSQETETNLCALLTLELIQSPTFKVGLVT